MFRGIKTLYAHLAVTMGEELVMFSYVGRKSQFGYWLSQQGISSCDYEVISYAHVISAISREGK